MKVWLIFAFCFNLILGLEVKNSGNPLLFESIQHSAIDVAKTLIGQDAPIRTVRGYKTKLIKQKKKEEAERLAKEAAEKARLEAEAAEQRAKGKGKKPPAPAPGEKQSKNKVWISKAAENADVNSIRTRITAMVKEANQWIQNNIGRHGQKDQFKARRLVERYNELPDRYMQVIGRCRDPGSLDDLEELRRSRPIRQENKEQVKLERSLMRKEKAAEKEEKIANREAAKADQETNRERRQAGGQRGGGGGGANGQRFRPNRVEKQPVKYYNYLSSQIEKRKLQRNELKCDPELHPECKKKGKPGQAARKKFRPDPREAMWTKINRAIRLAALEVRNECHIWDKLEKKTAKLKKKAWDFWVELDGGSQRTNAAKIPVVRDTLDKYLRESGN